MNLSSNINEGIRAVLFLTKRFYTHKKHKKHKKHTKHKTQTSDFPPLRCFLCA